MERVMIVEDTKIFKLIIKKILEENGYEVAGVASNWEEGIFHYKKLRPDIVITDLSMPEKNSLADQADVFNVEMSGIKVIKDIILINPKAKIIVCSSQDCKEIVVEAIIAGAKDYILKSAIRTKLLDALKRLNSN